MSRQYQRDWNFSPSCFSIGNWPVSRHNLTLLNSASLTISAAKPVPLGPGLLEIPRFLISVTMFALSSLAHSICSFHCSKVGRLLREHIETNIPLVADISRGQLRLS